MLSVLQSAADKYVEKEYEAVNVLPGTEGIRILAASSQGMCSLDLTLKAKECRQ